MEERAIDRLRKFARYARDKGVVKGENSFEAYCELSNKYLRMIWEVDATQIRKDGNWVLHAKGGEYRKWSGNLEWVVKWSPEAIQHYKSDKIARFPKEHILFRKGVTWSLVSTNPMTMRKRERNWKSALPVILPRFHVFHC